MDNRDIHGHVRLTQKNILRFLHLRNKPVSIDHIRFTLDAVGGIVYTPSAVLRVLKALQKKGTVHYTPPACLDKHDDKTGWHLSRKGKEYNEMPEARNEKTKS